jgi:hypothetical protein
MYKYDFQKFENKGIRGAWPPFVLYTLLTSCTEPEELLLRFLFPIMINLFC